MRLGMRREGARVIMRGRGQMIRICWLGPNNYKILSGYASVTEALAVQQGIEKQKQAPKK